MMARRALAFSGKAMCAGIQSMHALPLSVTIAHFQAPFELEFGHSISKGSCKT